MKTSRLLIAGLIFFAGTECQAEFQSIQREQSNPLTHSVNWFDGKHRHTVWLSDREMIEFVDVVVPQDSELIRSLAPNAALLKHQGGVRIWRLDALQIDSGSRTLNANYEQGTFSPVFHRSSDGGVRMALNGGVLVRFKPDWDEMQIRQWVTGRGASVIQQVKDNLYLLKTTMAGMAVLEWVNQVAQSAEVEYVAPDWWQEVFKR